MGKALQNTLSKNIFISWAFNPNTKKEKSYKDSRSYMDVISYVYRDKDGEEIRYKNGFGVDSYNITNTVTQMKAVAKHQSKKKTKDLRKIYHFYIKFRSENFDVNIAQIIGDEIGSYIYNLGYQVIYGVHENTKHPHIHFVFNSRNYLTGKQFHASKYERDEFLNKLKTIVLNSCFEYGITNFI